MDKLNLFAPFIGLCRHRIQTDGEGVTTLAAFHGCPLHCRYCLNPQCHTSPDRWLWHTPETLYQEVKQDELYFLATGGGITFGGGEPLAWSDFIHQFRQLCGKQWRITLETSLYASSDLLEQVIPDIDEFIIDIKDTNPEIYRKYTQRSSKLVEANLNLLLCAGKAEQCLIRLPLIPSINTETSVARSEHKLRKAGFTRFNFFKYIIP